MSIIQTFTHGKIVLSGEYAVVFGEPAVVIPAPIGMTITLEQDRDADLQIHWEQMEEHPEWQTYLRGILGQICHHTGETFAGTLTIQNQLPLGKGMGSSTALVIGVTRCLLHDREEEEIHRIALAIEDTVNEGHSGMDFAVIWEAEPIWYQRGSEIEMIDLPEDLLRNAILIDTGTPEQATPQLIAMVRDCAEQPDVMAAIKAIGVCSHQLRKNKKQETRNKKQSDIHSDTDARPSFNEILRAHHQAQISLRVVPKPIQELIEDIESSGGSGKVIGAGSQTGGAGMVLVLHSNPKEVLKMIEKTHYALLNAYSSI